MDAVFFERQEGQLCAQHCLNNLLQGPMFTAVDLASHARLLDEEERATMAEGGVSSPEFLRFMQQPSHNMDDSGYFSVQVIAKALSVWNLKMESLTSPHMKTALENPMSERAFICNHDSHWLTVRKLGQQWFNLNSLLKKPELISDTYLSLFLHQLQMEGYSIFVVVGVLPECEADQVLSLIRVQPFSLASSSSSSSSSTTTTTTSHVRETRTHKQSPSTQSTRNKLINPQKALKESFSSVVRGRRRNEEEEEEEVRREEEEELQLAMALSLEQPHGQHQKLHGLEEEQETNWNKKEEEEDKEEEAALAAAIYASLEEDQHSGTSSSTGASITQGARGDLGSDEAKESRDGDEARKDGRKTGARSRSTDVPSSQEELRRKRLKYLEQN